MLKLVIPERELYDENKNEFIIVKGATIQVEHSLVSISKWESKWNKPFISRTEKTVEENIDYIRCMTLTQNVNEEVYNNLTNENMNQISKYIAAPMTATVFCDEDDKSNEIITSELIYYWMIQYNIPYEYQKWHLNRLIVLINVCARKSQKPKKMSRNEIINRNRELNAKRRQELNTKG